MDAYPENAEPFEAVSELDAMEILRDVLDGRDFYEAAIVALSEKGSASMAGVRLAAPDEVPEYLSNAVVDNMELVASIDVELCPKSLVIKLARVAFRSLDGADINLSPITDDLYFASNSVSNHQAFAERSSVEHIVLSDVAKDSASSWDVVNKLAETSASSTLMSSFEIEVDGVLLSGIYREIETLQESIVSFEITIQRTHPSGKLVGTSFVVIESSSSTERLEPNGTLSTLIGKRKTIDEVMSVSEMFDGAKEIPVRTITKTQISDMHEAIALLKATARL